MLKINLNYKYFIFILLFVFSVSAFDKGQYKNFLSEDQKVAAHIIIPLGLSAATYWFSEKRIKSPYKKFLLSFLTGLSLSAGMEIVDYSLGYNADPKDFTQGAIGSFAGSTLMLSVYTYVF